MGAGRAALAVLPLPALQAPPEIVTYLGERNHRDLLLRSRLVRFQGEQAQKVIDTVHEQGGQARQGQSS